MPRSKSVYICNIRGWWIKNGIIWKIKEKVQSNSSGQINPVKHLAVLHVFLIYSCSVDKWIQEKVVIYPVVAE